jgi:hypothetical protein
MKPITRIFFITVMALLSSIAAAQTTAPGNTPIDAASAVEPSVSPVKPQVDTANQAATSATAAGPKLQLLMSPYTYHLNPKPTHRSVVVLGLEREHANGKVDGVAVFRNSFGQPSIYVYPWGGVYKSLLGIDNLHFKWSGGLIYGYRGEFKNEVANVAGFAPVVIFGLAYQFRPGWTAQVNMLGRAAVQFQLNAPLD